MRYVSDAPASVAESETMERTTRVISKRPRRAALGAAALALGLVLSLSSGVALGRPRTSDLTVTTTTDVVDANGGDCAVLQPADLPGPDGVVSLREAICAANNAPGKDTVSLPAGVYVLTIHGSDEDLNASGDLDIAGDLDLVGADQTETIIDGDGTDRVLHIDPTDATSLAVRIADLTIQGGDADTSFGGGIAIVGDDDTVVISEVDVRANRSGHDGAGIYNHGDLTIESSRVTSNTLNVFGFEAFGGGGIYNAGTLTVEQTAVVSNNVRGGAGGGLGNEGSVTLLSTTVSRNHAIDPFDGAALGGGIASQGEITLTSCTLLSNTASDAGGGLYTGNPSGAAAAVVSGTIFQDNAAGGGGGGIEAASDLHVRWSSIVSNTAASGGGGVRLYPAGGDTVSAAFSNTVLANNSGGDRGGGILVRARQDRKVNVSLARSSLRGNRASTSGGGVDIYVSNGGQAEATLRACTLASNTAGFGDGGGLSISAEEASRATAELEAATLSGNSADWNGGGVYIWASFSSTATLTMRNATVSGNSAKADGGGIYASGSGVRVYHGTLTQNRADDDDDDWGNGGGIRASGGTVILTGTLVALNADGSSTAGAIHSDLSGGVDGDAHNLIGDSEGGTGTAGTGTDIVTASSGLTPLAKRGGETETHGLAPWSPAVDGVPAAACVLSADQRGKTRPWDGDRDGNAACDIGAFELYPRWVFVPYLVVSPAP